jgi:gluconate 2-dehydrogenase subunit 3-like protein
VNQDSLTRRAFLVAFADALGVSAVALSWPEVARAAHDAHAGVQVSAASPTRFFSPADAADVEAIAAAIVPDGATPGAREAGVIHFIDRALATFLSSLAPEFRAQLAVFQKDCQERHNGIASFAALSPERGVEFLRTVDRTPFFERMRLLTLLGMFSSPAYGGNVGGAGWKLLGFEDRHVFEPPFGWYDRDYPGFEIGPHEPI